MTKLYFGDQLIENLVNVDTTPNPGKALDFKTSLTTFDAINADVMREALERIGRTEVEFLESVCKWIGATPANPAQHQVFFGTNYQRSGKLVCKGIYAYWRLEFEDDKFIYKVYDAGFIRDGVERSIKTLPDL